MTEKIQIQIRTGGWRHQGIIMWEEQAFHLQFSWEEKPAKGGFHLGRIWCSEILPPTSPASFHYHHLKVSFFCTTPYDKKKNPSTSPASTINLLCDLNHLSFLSLSFLIVRWKRQTKLFLIPFPFDILHDFKSLQDSCSMLGFSLKVKSILFVTAEEITFELHTMVLEGTGRSC